MNPHITRHATGAVEVTFRRMVPTDELVYYVRRCCRRIDRVRGHVADWRVVLHHEADRRRCRVRVSRCHEGGHVSAAEVDSDPFLAVRNAFARVPGRAPSNEREPEESGVFSATGADVEAM
ncbi:MAG: HPF/RaiA family ribosome-associated protein [Myxococcota bacterium]